MKRTILALLTTVLLVGIMGPPALADWVEADGHKMHFPQYPDSVGWDVRATYPYVLADDWTCSETGWVKDIHFWGSWVNGIDGEIIQFDLSIHADIPANPPGGPYSRPGELLWKREIPIQDVVVRPVDSLHWQGWYDPVTGWHNFNDHQKFYQYNVFLDSVDWYWQKKDTVYWLNISATIVDPQNNQWGWKSSLNHHLDDAVWAEIPIFNWVDLWEPPEFLQSLDLAFVITAGPEEVGACCYPDPVGAVGLTQCIGTTESDCIDNYQGVWEGAGTTCGGMQACCLSNGTCLDADSICCVNELSGVPQGPGTACTQTEACCLSDGSCIDVDPLCCDEMGGVPQGPGFACTQLEACCLSDGSCIYVDPVCCDDMGGTPQGIGTSCSANTVACCLTDGSCMDVDPLCCDELGGFVSPYSPVCLSDGDGNGIDDACEEPTGACCWPDSTCTVETQADCEAAGGTYVGDGTICLGDADNNGVNDACQSWQSGDPHKMHHAQLPDIDGWDVMATASYACGDDWQCSETGWVEDIHFWGSWMNDSIGTIDSFNITIWSNVPDPDGSGPEYSKPGDRLHEITVHSFNAIAAYPDTTEGWYNPANGDIMPDNHRRFYQYDIILPETERFWQIKDSIYWLVITAFLEDPQPYHKWGWKSSEDHFMDDAVWVDAGIDPLFWNELWEPPFFEVSMDLAFVITGEPGEPDTCTYYKPAYNDYAPAGMPDFDQKQDNWVDSVGSWSHCGPVALANCLWWFDSKYEDNTSPPPPTISDSYPLVSAYGAWDDHGTQNVLPFVDSLAIYCKTNQPGQSGTNVFDLAQGALDWMDSVGLGGDYTVNLYPVELGVFDFEAIRSEVLRSQDVILLIGFYQDPGGGYCEWIGGHFITIAGVCTDPADSTICVSDPFYDKNEGGPPPPHGPGVHNDAQYVSGPHGTMHHDSYDVIPSTCQFMTPPLFHVELANYPVSVGDLGVFYGQNRHIAGIDPIPPQPGLPIHTVIEYAVVICPDTTPEPIGACCWPDTSGIIRLCVETTEDSCLTYYDGYYEGDGTTCTGQQACCLADGTCIDADSLCCVNELGGVPQGAGTYCIGVQACCFDDNTCQDLDSMCCVYLGGYPQGAGTQCGSVQACCLPDGLCADLDSICCVSLNGKAQGTGTSCGAATIACCLPGGGCVNVDPLCCDDLGGTPSPWGAPACLGDGNGNSIDDACELDTCTYYKPSFPDYAPFSMPDFDQKQDAWVSPFTGNWSWCGPVALANCIWWFDSKFEDPASPPPPTISDSYSLISAYGAWDDHHPNNVVPFIQALAPNCNTDVSAPGTVLWDLEAGFNTWLVSNGLGGEYTTYVKLGPEFLEIRDSILSCQDVILLLGFYEQIPGGDCQWLGGHYVTAAGTCEDEFAVCVSDPQFDKNEGEPPIGAHAPTVHNDAQYVSGPHNTYHHDKYYLAPIMPPFPCPSPATWMFTNYPNNWADVYVFENENPIDPPVSPVTYYGNEIIVLLDAALIICPVEECDCLPGDANGSGDYSIGDATYMINYIFKGGPPPTPYRLCSGDANCDCDLSIGDAVYMINYIFKGGPPPCDCLTWLSLCGPPLRK